MFLPYICLGVFVLYLLFAVIFVIVKTHGYRVTEKHEKEVFSNPHIPTAIKEAGNLLAERKYGFIQNYHIFEATNKTFGLMSITYSIIGLMSLSMEVSHICGMHRWLGYLICFISIIFVILALYLTPTNRASQYLAAWRKCDKKMCEELSSICCYIALFNEYDATEESEKNKEIAEGICEKAREITAVIPEAESMLSGEEG